MRKPFLHLNYFFCTFAKTKIMFLANENIDNKIAIVIMLEKLLSECPKNENIRRYLELVREQNQLSDDEAEFYKKYADIQKVCAA